MTADYAFRISGRLTPALTGALAPLKSIDASGDTLLVGPVSDRAALHGHIAHLEALGLELVELRRLPAGDGDSPYGCPRCGRAGASVSPLTGTAASPAGLLSAITASSSKRMENSRAGRV